MYRRNNVRSRVLVRDGRQVLVGFIEKPKKPWVGFKTAKAYREVSVMGTFNAI